MEETVTVILVSKREGGRQREQNQLPTDCPLPSGVTGRVQKGRNRY